MTWESTAAVDSSCCEHRMKFFSVLGFGKEGGPGWMLWLSMELHPWVSSYMEPISLARRRPLRGSTGGEERVHPGKWERLVQTPGVPAQESSS